MARPDDWDAALREALTFGEIAREANMLPAPDTVVEHVSGDGPAGPPGPHLHVGALSIVVGQSDSELVVTILVAPATCDGSPLPPLIPIVDVGDMDTTEGRQNLANVVGAFEAAADTIRRHMDER